MRPLILAALCATLPITASAQTFRAESKLDVVALNATDFEVIETRTAGPRGYWCAAADFARSKLGISGGNRLYIKSGRGPSLNSPGDEAVIFTTDAARLSTEPSRGYLVSIRKEGYSLPAGHAYSFCADYRLSRALR